MIGRVYSSLRKRWPALVLAATVVACTGKLPHPPYSAQPSSALAEVPYPPPPAHVESIPARPTDESAVWIDGEWAWRGSKWSWKPGRWLVPPPNATFSPWTTVHGEDGTCYFAAGAWRDAQGGTVTEPQALAVAGASAAVVFDADGDFERTGDANASQGRPPRNLPRIAPPPKPGGGT